MKTDLKLARSIQRATHKTFKNLSQASEPADMLNVDKLDAVLLALITLEDVGELDLAPLVIGLKDSEVFEGLKAEFHTHRRAAAKTGEPPRPYVWEHMAARLLQAGRMLGRAEAREQARHRESKGDRPSIVSESAVRDQPMAQL